MGWTIRIGAVWLHAARYVATGLVLFAVGPAAALTNGDFAEGLLGWTTTGPVSVVDGELVLADDGPSSSGTWQAVASETPRAVLEFELLGALSPFTPVDPFGFPDVFAASIYLLDDATGFDPATSAFGSAVSVLTVDWTGIYDLNAVVTPSDRGGEWVHVAIAFDSPSAWIVPAFELFELGFQGGDSQVRIDDVTLTQIPEPGVASLLALGLVGLARRSRRVAGR